MRDDMRGVIITFRMLRFFLFLVFIVIIFPNLVVADITTVGNLFPDYPGAHPDPWNIHGFLTIGSNAYADLLIDKGSAVTNNYGFVGRHSSANGRVTITGPGSLWENSRFLYIGYSGEAEMLVSDGGKVVSAKSYVGYDVGANGIATITGLGSLWENSANLYVGYDGDANMVILDGGHVISDNGCVGYGRDSAAYVSVTGPNSLWENSGDLTIGRSGDMDNYPSVGILRISDGGRVENASGTMGLYGDSTGFVTVTGPGSLWENSGDLYVGYRGYADMEISNGGHVKNATGYISYGFEDSEIFSGSAHGLATITGPGSLWESSGDLYVGYTGDANMVVSDSGKVVNNDGYIGHFFQGKGEVSVSGPSSLWENSGLLYIGDNDPEYYEKGVLNISNGGTVEANEVIIWSRGTISGNGNLIAGSITNYGILRPGNSIGTLNIDGDLTFEPNSTLEVEIDNSGNSDLLAVTGDVDIVGGTVQAISTETITGIKQYTIIEANSVTGTFDTLDTALLDTDVLTTNAALGYESDSVLLHVMALRFNDPNIAFTDNQKAVGSAFQRIAEGGGNSITTALQGLGSNGQVRSAYDQLSGQTRPPLAPITAAGTSRFLGTVSDRLYLVSMSMPSSFNSGPLFAMAGPDSTFANTRMYDTGSVGGNFALGNGTGSFGDQKWGFWGRGYGLFGDRDSEGGAPGYKYTVYGTSFGFDYQVTDSTLLGVTGGYSNGDVDYSLAGSKSDISGKHIGIYGSRNTNNWHFDSILTYSSFEYQTERFISMLGQKIKGDFDGHGLSGYLEARYDWRDYNSWLLQPLTSFQFSYLNLDNYTETGGSGSLSYDEQSYHSYKGSLGMKATKKLDSLTAERETFVQFRGRWIHEFGAANSNVDAHFASNPGVVFKVSDNNISRDSVVFGTGLYTRLSSRLRLLIDYDMSLSDDDTAHLVSAALQYRR